MTHIQATIPEENLLIVKQLIQKLGGEISEVKSPVKKSSKSKIKSKNEKVPIDFLFGTWPDFDIDPRDLRKKSWSRKK